MMLVVNISMTFSNDKYDDNHDDNGDEVSKDSLHLQALLTSKLFSVFNVLLSKGCFVFSEISQNLHLTMH